jgi:hypothetical protein
MHCTVARFKVVPVAGWPLWDAAAADRRFFSTCYPRRYPRYFFLGVQVE